MEINQIRTLYSEAAKDYQKTKELYNYLVEASANKSPILIAYLAASQALQAKHAFNPFYKLENIQKSQRTFQEAIELAPNNIEARFLRFSIQLHTPPMLGLSPNLNEDKQVIVEHISQSNLDKNMKKVIADYLLKSGQCTAIEKENLLNYTY